MIVPVPGYDPQRVLKINSNLGPVVGAIVAIAYDLIEAQATLDGVELTVGDYGMCVTAAGRSFRAFNEETRNRLRNLAVEKLERAIRMTTDNAGRLTEAELADLLKNGGDDGTETD